MVGVHGRTVRCFLTAQLGAGTVLQAGVFVGARATIGRDCWLGAHAVLAQECVLGDRVRLQPGAIIGSDGYGYDTIRSNKRRARS